MISRARATAALAAAGAALAALPALGLLPAFYESFLYVIFSWIALATSWSILSGYAGYWSFGHGAFFGAGMYTTATLAAGLGVPFLWTLAAAGAVAALLGAGIGAVVFRVRGLRGELFGLLTLAITFVLATIVLNTRIDGGPGVYLSAVPLPRLMASPTGTLYLLGLILAVATVWLAHAVAGSRLGLGLFAIHDDEDVAEVKGVPAFSYKLRAFALSAGIAGVAGGIHAMYVSYVTVGETFSITVPLYVVLMSVLGGARHWLGPAVGATIITASLYAFIGGQQAVLGRAAIALLLILVILLLPDGVVPTLLARWRAWRGRWRRFGARRRRPPGGERPPVERARRRCHCRDVWKAFGGIRALRGVSLRLEPGEIVGLVGPNGSGKTTLINVISGHYALDRGSVELGGDMLSRRAAHEIAGLGVSRTYQIPRPFAHLTALDNVALAAAFGAARPGRAQARAEARDWLEFTGLGARAATLPAELNLHERKFLELARALAARPRVILLDEVLSGLNSGEISERHRSHPADPRERRQHPVRRAPDARRAGALRPRGGAERGRGHHRGQPARGHARPARDRGLSGHGSCCLRSSNLAIAYGDAPAVWDASLHVDGGELVAVIGPNGAGKSTLVNAIAGLLRARSGELRLGGVDLMAVSSHQVCRHGIALVPEGRRLFTRMSVEENLELGCYRAEARRARAAGLDRVYALFPILLERRGQLAGSLSGGQQQMVAIGRALMARPRLLLLDEPSLGLAPAIVDRMFESIRAIHAEGVAILLVEQNVARALEIADRAYVLEQGRIVASGLASALFQDPRIQEAYLGARAEGDTP